MIVLSLLVFKYVGVYPNTKVIYTLHCFLQEFEAMKLFNDAPKANITCVTLTCCQLQ